jgi:uncharacterized protein YdeI (YjbR/CyaY-like superfamily)
LNAKVDAYINRSTKWPAEMKALRPILLDRGLEEAIKWGKPCYSHEGRNIVIMQEMKDFMSLMFFHGMLLSDPEKILEEQGPNSRSALRICFTSVDEVKRLAATIGAYVDEALTVDPTEITRESAPELVLAEELQARLDADPALDAAFRALTPGRQREYNLHISEAKQSATRSGRVEKHVQRILEGKGLRDR